MAPTKPTLELLRSLSDEHVLRALMSQRRATRAEIAAASGLSKPTVSESVRRLSASGAVVDTGERTTGRGRVGTYYALPAATGRALVASLAPDGIVAEAVDVYGQVVARCAGAGRPLPGAGRVARALTGVAGEVADGPFRLAVVSAADPVDRESGRLVELPDAPFLLGALDPPAVLADLVDGPVTVDNDVNWAARAERARRARSATSPTCSSARALGCAVAQRRRGPARPCRSGRRDRLRGDHRPGRRGDAADRRLRRARPAPCRLDRDRRAGAARPSRRIAEVRSTLGRAVAGALSAVVALPTRPSCWSAARGAAADVLAAVVREFARRPAPVPVEAAAVTDEPSLAAARETALEQLRDAVIAAARIT